MSIQKLPYKEFMEIYSKVPRLTVDLFINTEKGILLSKRDIPPALGMWHLPGGTVYYEESLENAAKRIAKEEIGIEVEIEKLIGVIEYSTKHAVVRSIGLVYSAKITGGTIAGSYQAKEILFYKTVPENTLPEQAKFIKENSLI